MSAWELYFLLKLDDVRFLLRLFGILGVFFGIGLGLWGAFRRDEKMDLKPVNMAWKIFIPAWLLAISMATLLPSTKQMAAIMVVPAIVNNEQIQKLPNEVMELLGMGIDKAKEMLKPEEK